MDRSRRDRRAELGAVVRRYAAHNDRFEQWLNARDAAARESQRARFVGLSDEVRRELAATRSVHVVCPRCLRPLALCTCTLGPAAVRA
jgi:hypothetical protein